MKIKKIWQKWKKISNRLLDKEATIILSIFYWLLVAPPAIVFKLLADPLNLKRSKKSFWFKKDVANAAGLEEMRKQY